MRKAVLLTIVLFAVSHCFGQATFIKIDHFGNSDKPIFPVIISILPKNKAELIDHFDSNFVTTNKKAFDSSLHFIRRFRFPTIPKGGDGFDITIGNIKNTHVIKLQEYRLVNRNLSVAFFKSLINNLSAQKLDANLVLYLKQYILIRIDY